MFQHLEVGKEEEGPAKDIKNVCPGGILGEDTVLGPGSDPFCLVLVVLE